MVRIVADEEKNRMELEDKSRKAREAMEDIPIGKIGLFTMDGEGYVKQRGADALISLNPQYDPLPMREGIRCNGLVIGILNPVCLK